MSDRGKFKNEGLQFARSLQMLIKMVTMFSADHKSAAGMMRRSYDTLNPLLKQTRYLTVGFVEQRILLNNILTADSNLKPLENEFLKRGIGAISFDAGITFAAFVKAIAAVTANPKTIHENGGLMPFLESRQLEFVRIFPAAKNEIRNDDGDTVLEMGSEEYLISKALNNIHSVPLNGIEGILGRLEVGGGGSTDAAAGSAQDGGSGSGGTSGHGDGSGKGPGARQADGYGDVAAVNGGASGAASSNAGTVKADGPIDHLQKIADQKFEASLRNPQEDPQKAYVELGRILSNLRPDAPLRNLSGGLDRAVGNASQEEMTAEVFEDSALRWALKRLAAIPMGGDAVIVEEPIFRVLMRSLQATHAASRLAQKLADFAKDYVLPKETLQRLQEELRWLTLTSHAKLRELLGVEHFSASQFRRMLDLIKDLIRMGSPEGAEALGVQYFSIFEDYPSIRIEEVGRVPELLHSLAGVQGDFWPVAEDRLTKGVSSAALNRVIHVQIVNSLVALARVEARYEKFDAVRRVGSVLEGVASDAAAHVSCCRAALPLLLQPAAVDRITELFLEKRQESNWTSTATALLRWADPSAVERIFARLDMEPLAGNRLALIRLLGRVGPNGLSAASERLKSPEWYIVRNACKLLAELKDPELFTHLLPVFSYPDERVQKTALQAVKKSRLPHRQLALARALPVVPQVMREEILDELTFQPNVEIITALEDFIRGAAPGDKAITRAIRLLASIPGAQTGEALCRIALSTDVDESSRRAAQEAAEDGLSRLSPQNEKLRGQA